MVTAIQTGQSRFISNLSRLVFSLGLAYQDAANCWGHLASVDLAVHALDGRFESAFRQRSILPNGLGDRTPLGRYARNVTERR